MAAPLPVALVVQKLLVKETAVKEILENDVQEQGMDTVSKGWSKDQWISGVLERAIRIVSRSAEKGYQEFQVTPFDQDSVRFSVSDDKELGTFYRDRSFRRSHLGSFFPINNVDLKLQNNGSIHVQGTQRPDSISLLKLSCNGDKKDVCICFEGDAHDLDANKSAGGMFSYEKMFQDVSLCHDVNPEVPGIFITSVLWRHDKQVFPTFSNWAEQFLHEHVLLVEQLLQYISNKETSSLHRAMQQIDRDMAENRQFDFFCWINAQDDNGGNGDMFDSSVDECFDLMYDKSMKSNEELVEVLKWRGMYGRNGDWISEKIQRRIGNTTDGLLKNKFCAMAIRTNLHGIPVVVFAVPRVSTSDIKSYVGDANHVCSGMWYPMHVDEYLRELGQGNMNNFLVSDAKTDSFEAFSKLPSTDKTRMLESQDFETKFKSKMKGQLGFTLPWLWINIGFLCKLKSSLTYSVAKKRLRANTITAYIAFTRKHATQVNSRDNVQNEMEMFSEESTSLFAHLCRERQATSGIDEELGSFLQNKCGWSNAKSASSPAVFFALLGVRNLITAHTLAKRCIGTPNKYSAELEKVKDSFPLAAQVEIDYALECLCRHYYFVQDKSGTHEDVVSRVEFDRMKRKLKKEVDEARAEASAIQHVAQDVKVDASSDAGQNDGNMIRVKKEDKSDEEEDASDTSQLDSGGYKAVRGEKVSDKPTDINIDQLKDKTVVVKFKIRGRGNIHRWYRGKVLSKPDKQYLILFDDGDKLYVSLSSDNYGVNNKWVIVENT